MRILCVLGLALLAPLSGVAAPGTQMSVEYWAGNTPRTIEPLESSARAQVRVVALKEAPLVATERLVLGCGAKDYLIEKEGLYRAGQVEPSRVVRQILLYRGDVWRFAGHLSRLYLYGTRHQKEDVGKWSQRAQNGEPLSLQCGCISKFVGHHLRAQNIISRPVSCVASRDWNHYDDGHALVEICDPAEKRYLLFDCTLGARVLYKGRYLDLQHVTQLYRSGGRADEIEFVNANSKIDPLMDYEAFLAKGYPDEQELARQKAKFLRLLKNDVETIHAWYGRLMHIPLIGDYFAVRTDEEEALMRSLLAWSKFTRLTDDTFREKFYRGPCCGQ